MNLKRFWSDLSVPNKFGLSFVCAAALLLLLLFVF